jgi:hypothetical protein
MNTEELLKNEKDRYKELSQGIPETDLELLKDLILKAQPELRDYASDPEKERKFLSRLNSRFLYSIHNDRPSNIRAYVENELKKQDFDNRAHILWNRAANLPAGESPEAEKLKDEVRKLRKEIIAWNEKEYANSFYSILMHAVHNIRLRRDGMTEKDRHVRKFMYPGKDKDTDEFWENI